MSRALTRLLCYAGAGGRGVAALSPAATVRLHSVQQGAGPLQCTCATSSLAITRTLQIARVQCYLCATARDEGLSCRQQVAAAYALRLSSARKDIGRLPETSERTHSVMKAHILQVREFVNDVMDIVELTPLRHTLVGIPGQSGLSVEQRKRLTIAVELVANPSVIFMDEPTSGEQSFLSVACQPQL